MEAACIIASIDRHRLPRLQLNRVAQKAVNLADLIMQLGQHPFARLFLSDLAVAFAAQQFVHQVGDGDAAVARKSNSLQKVHAAEIVLRPQSLATQ